MLGCLVLMWSWLFGLDVVLGCLVPSTGLLLKINNLYYNKLKYLTKDFNSLSIKIEKELWENKDEPMEACLQSVACRSSAVSTQTKCRVKLDACIKV